MFRTFCILIFLSYIPRVQAVSALDVEDFSLTYAQTVLQEPSWKKITAPYNNWVSDANSFIHTPLPPMFSGEYCQASAAFLKMMAVGTFIAEKKAGVPHRTMKPHDMVSLDAFHKRLFNDCNLEFWPAMTAMKIMTENTSITPILCRQEGLLFKISDWIHHIKKQEMLMALPISFEEPLHKFQAHGDTLYGGFETFLHDFGHIAFVAIAEIMGQADSPDTSSVVHLTSVCQTIMDNVTVNDLPQHFINTLRKDLSWEEQIECIVFYFLHEDVQAFPILTPLMHRVDPDLIQYFNADKTKESALGALRCFRAHILWPYLHDTYSTHEVEYRCLDIWKPNMDGVTTNFHLFIRVLECIADMLYDELNINITHLEEDIKKINPSCMINLEISDKLTFFIARPAPNGKTLTIFLPHPDALRQYANKDFLLYSLGVVAKLLTKTGESLLKAEQQESGPIPLIRNMGEFSQIPQIQPKPNESWMTSMRTALLHVVPSLNNLFQWAKFFVPST